MAVAVKGKLRGVDRFHQQRGWLAFPYAVAKKFGDDQGGYLAALVSYYAFFSLFPLLLVFVTIFGIVLRGNPGLQHQILNSALAKFPIIGSDIAHNTHSLGAHPSISLVIGLLLALWAGMGAVRAMENAMDTVWNVPHKHRPNMVASVTRGLAMLAVLGVTTVLSAVAAGVGSGGHTWWWAAGGIVLSLALNFVLFMLAFRLLTAAKPPWSEIRAGAWVAAIAWTVLQALGGFYVSHQLKGASSTYGTFAIVIGLLAWFYLGAQVTLYAAEINVVKARKLWPRSLVQPPLTDADHRVLEHLAKTEERYDGHEVTSVVGQSELAQKEPSGRP
ncbi:MAG: YihY/virulence factor BrkB family protein [Acidimicrobiaceae bacterium]|nr:YihY/virulence factor BrkB family protein [Acidimicrobiaceae bacterium]